MKRLFAVYLAAILILPYMVLALNEEDPAGELVEKMDRLLRGAETSQGGITMIIKKKRWRKPRTIKMKFWEEKAADGEPGKSYILITHPIEEAGKGFLKIGNEMWSYFPDVNTSAKIPPSMMLQSWMGSDFTNDDLVRESSIVHDYEHEIIDTREKDGVRVADIKLTPKPDAPVTWGKIILTLRKQDALPLREEFYNERGELVRVMEFGDIREMGGRTLPTRWTVTPRDKPGDSTTLILEDMRFDVKIDPRVFTMATLRKGGI